MSTIKRIPTSELQVGMYIAEIRNEWIPDTNLSRHGLIKRETAIEQIIGLGVTDVYIDVDKGLDCKSGVMADVLEQRLQDELAEIQNTSSTHKSVTQLGDESSPAARVHSEALNLVSRVMADVKMGAAVKLQPIEDMADDIAESIRRNQSALACFTRLRHKDEYLIEHSFSVAVLMGILSRSMSFSNDDVHELITGAFLHDIGKVRVSDAILNKPGTLSSDEWQEMKRHVQYGEEILAKSNGISRTIHEICAQHHERTDGTGYPRRLSGSAYKLHGRMMSVIDVYDAITAERCYHHAITPTDAMKKLLEWSETHFDKEITRHFIACMSIYPPGSLVELESGKIAFVVEANTRKPHEPLVNAIYDGNKRRKIAPQLINLALSSTTEKIKRAVDSSEYDIALENYL